MDTINNIVLGKASGYVEQEIDAKNSSTEFSEYMKFGLNDADISTDGMTVKVDSDCSHQASWCKQDTAPWGAPRPITTGQSIDGTWTRSWNGNVKHADFKMAYTLTVEIPSGGVGSTSWGDDGEPGGGEYYVRCDNEVGKYAGCVVPSFTPTFVIDKKYSLARQFIGMAQSSMSSHPGWEGHGQPLKREADAATEQKNRGVICDKTFKPDPSTPTPAQCDEYPFAKSKQSGRQQGVTSGAQCQQYMVVSETIDGKEYVSLTWPGMNQGKMPPAAAKCARASMTKLDNEGVGGDLGRKTQQWRLIDNDPYWVDAGNK
ncbi:NucA/NucB deoxyribonuclease domain-containing protein [Streptomyces puniciscabiei]